MDGTTYIQVRMSEKEKQEIVDAAKIISIAPSTFGRMICLEKARRINSEAQTA